MSNKKPIRFFNDREVRAVWDDEHSKWYFSATDVVRAINDEPDYTKSRNYWKYLKGKLGKEGIQLVSDTNHFKFEAPDGKMRKADVLDAEGTKIIFLLNSYCCLLTMSQEINVKICCRLFFINIKL
jgi:cell filamentation protein